MVVLSLIDNRIKKELLLKNVPIQDKSAKTIPYFKTKIAKIDSLFMTKTAKNLYPLGPHIKLCSPFKGVTSPPPPGTDA